MPDFICTSATCNRRGECVTHEAPEVDGQKYCDFTRYAYGDRCQYFVKIEKQDAKE